MKILFFKSHGLLILLALLFCAPLSAGEDDKPFAEHRLVLQISDGDPFKQTLVLNVASNLLKHYGPDKIDIEIVAFGPGLRLLFNGNTNLGRMQGLDANGVRFSACSNTMRKMSSLLGHEVQLNELAIPVTAGVVRILELADKGYKVVKP